MNNNRRRNFRSRPQKNNYRRRSGSLSSNVSNGLNNNGNINFNRNGSMNNIHNVEKTMQKSYLQNLRQLLLLVFVLISLAKYCYA